MRTSKSILAGQKWSRITIVCNLPLHRFESHKNLSHTFTIDELGTISNAGPILEVEFERVLDMSVIRLKIESWEVELELTWLHRKTAEPNLEQDILLQWFGGDMVGPR